MPGITDEAAAGSFVPGVAGEAVAAASSVPCVAAVAVAGELIHLPRLSSRFHLQLAGAVVVPPLAIACSDDIAPVVFSFFCFPSFFIFLFFFPSPFFPCFFFYFPLFSSVLEEITSMCHGFKDPIEATKQATTTEGTRKHTNVAHISHTTNQYELVLNQSPSTKSQGQHSGGARLGPGAPATLP